MGIKPWGQSSRFDTLFQTTDRHAAEDFLLKSQFQFASGVQLSLGSNVDMDIKAFDFSDLKVSSIRYGTEVSASFLSPAPSADKSWLFIYYLGGQSIGRRLNFQADPGDAAVFRHVGAFDFMASSTFEALTLTVTANGMLQAYRVLHGDIDPFNPELGMSVHAGSAPALTLLRTITRLSETPKYPHQAAHRLERGIKESVLLEILMNWPGAILPTAQENVLPASTRLARDFIHAHINDLPTVSDVAASCRIGVRALDRGFKKYMGVSPLQYMLDLRLQGVHEDLIANRNGNTVTDVAVYWGFLNLGIFAARYRERFGELPSKTLLQSRQLRQRLN